MKYSLVVSSASQQDIANALTHCLTINPLVAEKLLAAIDEAYEKIESTPEFYSFYGDSKTLRRYLLRSFPYCFVYQVKADEVFIAGFHHTHQNPDDILKRAQ